MLPNYSTGNLILHDHGADRFLREYGGIGQPINWIDWIPIEDDCEQELNVSSTPINFYTSPPGDIRGVLIYTQDMESSANYYLRVNVLTHHVTLECEGAFLNVSPTAKVITR